MKVTALYHMGDGQNDMPVTYVPSLRAQHAHLCHFERNTTPSVIPNPSTHTLSYRAQHTHPVILSPAHTPCHTESSTHPLSYRAQHTHPLSYRAQHTHSLSFRAQRSGMSRNLHGEDQLAGRRGDSSTTVGMTGEGRSEGNGSVSHGGRSE